MNKDEKYCQNLDSDPKNICLAIFKEDNSFCQSVSSGNRQYSLICERIESLETKDDCYRDYSRLSNDQVFCDKISNSNQKDQCLVNIALNISDR